MNDFYTYTGKNVNDFITNYRQALQAQRDSALKQLEQQRRNDYATIMGRANKAGMLYSNFPQRDKIKYNAQNYMPAYTKAQTGYQTALDTLRSNAAKIYNQIQYYNELSNDLNTYGLNKNTATTI